MCIFDSIPVKAGHWYICHHAYCCRADNLTVKEGERFMCEKDGVVKGFVIKEPEKYFKEIEPEFEAELDKAYKCADKVQYENGKQDALKWKKATEYKELDRYVAIIDYNNKVAITKDLDVDDYYIELEDLLKLPKEE